MNGMEPSDQAMVEAIRGGDQTAAARLIHLHYQRIYAFLRRLCSHDDDAADLTQKTFARAWQAFGSFVGRSSLSTWIHGIAYHVYLDWRRSNKPAEPRSDEWWSCRPAPDDAPDEVAGRNDFASRLFQTVETLPPNLRETIHLHYYEGLSLQETADAMEVATSTVKYRQRQAISELQQKLGSERVGIHTSTLAKP
jgi:RNA polymerase sigma-70 factor (ECF subfamily)